MAEAHPSRTWTEDEIRAKYSKLTDEINRTPYDLRAWRARGDFFRFTDYHDLAVGDYYKALLLIDDALDTSGEYHNQALEAFGFEPATDDDDDDELPAATAVPFKRLALSCYADLAECLWGVGARKSAQRFCDLGLNVEIPAEMASTEDKTRLLAFKMEKLTTADTDTDELNTHEPDRYTAKSLDLLNAQLASVAPKLIVKAVDLPVLHSSSSTTLLNPTTIKQLGLFAVSDISPGELILKESSLLAVNNRLYDELCDACSAELPSDPSESHACPECMTAVFCSESCLEQAMEAYHPAVCGNEAIEAINKDPDAAESSDALYGLLLGRAIAMAETQDINPLDLIEIAFLWGDYSPFSPLSNPSSSDYSPPSAPNPQRPSNLPWSLTHNLTTPLHLLTLLDIDIYTSTAKYDLWMLNTLFAKFRGVANARMDVRTGRPEVAASHYRWCLANHSCAPNVGWEWGGEIRMWARGGAEGENGRADGMGKVVRWGPGREDDGKDGMWKGGLRKGEEVLNHYCDVRLPVKERREWAAGALGGMCMCERCVWEAAQEGQDTEKP